MEKEHSKVAVEPQSNAAEDNKQASMEEERKEEQELIQLKALKYYRALSELLDKVNIEYERVNNAVTEVRNYLTEVEKSLKEDHSKKI